MSDFTNSLRLITFEAFAGAVECLRPVAMSEHGQSKCVANYLPAKRNSSGGGDFEIVAIPFVASQLCEASFLSLLPLSRKYVIDADLRAHCQEPKYLSEIRRPIRIVRCSTRFPDLAAALAPSFLDTVLVRSLERGDPS